MFSKADYELAARILGLPTPETPAEQAAAAPVVARVLRQFGRGGGPMPGVETEGFYTGATHSLNGYPDNNNPMQEAKLASRLRTETQDPAQDDYLMQLLMSIDPNECPLIVELIQALMSQQDQHMDALSAQRPMEYDTPNLGANYSVLNAPSSNGIEPSRAYHPLSLG